MEGNGVQLSTSMPRRLLPGFRAKEEERIIKIKERDYNKVYLYILLRSLVKNICWWEGWVLPSLLWRSTWINLAKLKIDWNLHLLGRWSSIGLLHQYACWSYKDRPTDCINLLILVSFVILDLPQVSYSNSFRAVVMGRGIHNTLMSDFGVPVLYTQFLLMFSSREFFFFDFGP